MKAKIKATGEIGIVTQIDVLLKDDFVSFSSNKVEILQNYADATIEPDYWARLEHQYAGMAMQGMLSNATVVTALVEGKSTLINTIPRQAKLFAHALVQKLKEKEERK